MRNLYKTTNIALIFTLIGVFLSAETGYSLSQAALRVPLVSQDTEMGKRIDEVIEKYSEERLKELVIENVKVLKKLPPLQAKVLIMYYVKGMSLDQIVAESKKTLKKLPKPVARQYKRAGLRNLIKELVVNDPEPLKILTMLFIEGKSPSEIAKELNISKEIVSQYKRADFSRLKKLAGVNSSSQLVGLLKMLSEQQKEVVIKFFIEGKSPSKIADELGIGLSTVSIHKQDGLSNLKELAAQKQLIIDNPELFQKLSKRQREVLTKFFIEGKNRSEIADELGISQSTASTHKQDGLSNLKELAAQKQLIIDNPKLFKKLSKRQIEVLAKFFIEGKTPSEIADELGIGPSTFRIHKQAGIKKLRKLVNELPAPNRQNPLRYSI